MKKQPSLKNIYKELKLEFPESNLDEQFNEEKIFLLNCSLTVQKGKPGSHMKKWINMTNDIIKHISEYNKDCVYLLLGNYAKSKAEFIDSKNILIDLIHHYLLKDLFDQIFSIHLKIFQEKK